MKLTNVLVGFIITLTTAHSSVVLAQGVGDAELRAIRRSFIFEELDDLFSRETTKCSAMNMVGGKKCSIKSCIKACLPNPTSSPTICTWQPTNMHATCSKAFFLWISCVRVWIYHFQKWIQRTRKRGQHGSWFSSCAALFLQAP